MKHVLAVLLMAVTAAACSGCGSQPSQPLETTATSETAAAAATTAAATAETQEITQAATQATLSPDVKSKLDQALTGEDFQGVVQITRGGEVMYQYVSGDDDNGKPLTIDASLPIGSVSKQFCAAAVMLLCDQNKLRVDDTLDKYFPDYQDGKQMTVRQLLQMSSGLPDHLSLLEPSAIGNDEAENVNTIQKALFEQKLHFTPGDDFEYSNANFFLLADVVEQVSGVPYRDFIRKNFFEPLEMTHTGFIEEIGGEHAWTSALSKTELAEELFYRPGITKGAGDVISNPADMGKWMRGLSGGKVLSADAFRQMTDDVNPNSAEEYGYGLYHMPFGGVGHEGQIPPDFGAVDYLNPARDVYLFAASNSPRGMSYVQQLPQALTEILFGN